MLVGLVLWVSSMLSMVSLCLGSLSLCPVLTITGDKFLVPRLTIFVELEDGLAMDAALSPGTRKYLEMLALAQQCIDGSEDGTRDHQNENRQALEIPIDR